MADTHEHIDVSDEQLSDTAAMFTHMIMDMAGDKLGCYGYELVSDDVEEYVKKSDLPKLCEQVMHHCVHNIVKPPAPKPNLSLKAAIHAIRMKCDRGETFINLLKSTSFVCLYTELRPITQRRILKLLPCHVGSIIGIHEVLPVQEIVDRGFVGLLTYNINRLGSVTCQAYVFSTDLDYTVKSLEKGREGVHPALDIFSIWSQYTDNVSDLWDVLGTWLPAAQKCDDNRFAHLSGRHITCSDDGTGVIIF